MGFHCADIASNYLIRDFMLETFEQGVFPALDLTNKLLQLVDKDLWNLIELSGGQPTFALSWIITWFSHDIENFSRVQRIFDACLATHPLFCTYMTVAQMVLAREKLIDHEMPEISGHIVFKEMKDNQEFQIEEAIELASILFDMYPPSEVLQLIKKENEMLE